MGISKSTFSVPAITNFDEEGIKNGQGKQLATGGTEVTFFKLTSGSGSAHISVYDSVPPAGLLPSANDLRWELDCSTTTNDINPFSYPLTFLRGVFVILDEGSNFEAQLSIAVIPSQVPR